MSDPFPLGVICTVYPDGSATFTEYEICDGSPGTFDAGFALIVIVGDTHLTVTVAVESNVPALLYRLAVYVTVMVLPPVGDSVSV